MSRGASKVLALSGGVGGSKLALGLARVLQPDELTVVVNTADDFRHLELAISPDVDTLLYTLAGIADPERGWGRRDETWRCLAALEQLGGATWFALGDADLAMHLERTRRLAAGERLSNITDDIRRRLGIATRVVPMSDDPVRTRVRLADGWVDFQDYFVRRRCEPTVQELRYDGADAARAAGVFAELAAEQNWRAVIICPSNPWLSIDPILALPGVRAALAGCAAPVVAVSPLVDGRAVKGPTAKLMAELGLHVGDATIAAHYTGLADVLVVDAQEHSDDSFEGPIRVQAPTLMRTVEDRERLARRVLEIADAVPRKVRR